MNSWTRSIQDLINEKNTIRLIGVLILLISADIYPIVYWNHVQYVSISGFLLIYFSLKLSIYRESIIYISRSDVFLVLFIIYCFLSALWANDIALIWPNSFIWLFGYLLVLFLRDFLINYETTENLLRFFEVIFYIVLFSSSISIFLNLDVATWSKTWNANPNYSNSYLLCLLPFAIFSKWEVAPLISKMRNILISAITIFISINRGTDGVSLAFILVIGILIIIYFKDKIQKKYYLIIPILVLLFVSFFFHEQVAEIINSKLSDGRYQSILLSLNMIQDNPILGVGLNNWCLHAFQSDVSSIHPFNLPHTFLRWKDHNYPLTILAELGILGFSLLSIYLFKTFKSRLSQLSHADSFSKALTTACILYLLLINYYSLVNAKHFFTGIQMFLLIAFAMFNSSQTNLKINPKSILLIGSTSCFVWFGYMGFKDYKYSLFHKEELRYQNQNLDLSIELLEDLYNPIFHSHHKYNKPLLYKLAELYYKKGNPVKANHILEKYLYINPYHGESLLLLASIHFKEYEDLEMAKKYASRIFNIQNTNCQLNLLLFDIAMAEKNKADALKYLEYFEACTFSYGKSYKKMLPQMTNDFKSTFEE